MENKIETVVEGTETIGAATHAGMKKGAVIIGVAGVVGIVGVIATKFIIKPVIRKIKTKKSSKNVKLPEPPSQSEFDFDDEFDDEIFKSIDENED